MAIINFGQIADAIAAGKRAEAKLQTPPIINTYEQYASLQFSSADYGASAIAVAQKFPNEFVWSFSKWGDTTDRVTE